MALHLPLVSCNMRAPVSHRVWATDATPTAGWATVAEVPEVIADALFDMAEQKGSHVRLDGTDEPRVWNP